MLRVSICGLAIFAFAGIAFGQTESAAEEESPWSGSTSLGFLSTSGNTDSTSYNAAFAIAYATNKWTHSFDAAAIGAKQTDVSTAEAYQADWKSTYDFSEHNYIFGLINWRKDRFSGVDQQLSESIGYGRRLITTPSHNLSVELGAGHRSADLSDGTSESSVVGRGALEYIWTFSETAAFEQTVSVEAGPDNTFTESISEVRARLLGDFAIVFSYTLRNNSDVPVGSVNTDKFTAISIEYAF